MNAANTVDVAEPELVELPPPDVPPEPAGDAGDVDVAGPPAGARPRAEPVALAVLALVAWTTILFLGRIWGILLEKQGHDLVLYTPPLLGGYREALTPALALPVPVAVALVVGLPRLARRLPWRPLLGAATAAGALWGLALALVDGNQGLIAGLTFEADYAPPVEQIRALGPGRWLAAFTDAVPAAGIQVRAHPPGLPLLLAGLDRLGLGGEWWAALVVLAVAVSTIVAVAVAVREVCGEDTARRALPFVVLAPAVLFVFTSFDALYMGVSAWFVTAMVLAVRRGGRAGWWWAALAGVLAAAAIMGSYGMVLMGLVPLPVVVRARSWGRPLVAAGVALACIVAFVPFGFWWLSGLGATREAYYALGLDRPYQYFLLNDVSALTLVVGPAVAAGLALTRDVRLWTLLGGGAAAMAVADLSGMSTGEVERIWLPFAVWLLPAGAALAGRVRWQRCWLAVQAACPVVVTVFIRTFW